MKLLRVKTKGFRNCADDFGIDMIARSKKTSEDKEYELLEIDDGLYVYNTVGIVGKNASGKSTTLEILDWCYDILSTFRVERKKCNYDGISFEIIFYEEGYVYKYETELANSNALEDQAIFVNQKIYRKKYYKSKLKNIYEEWDEELDISEAVPEDISLIFYVLKKTKIREILYDEAAEAEGSYSLTFKLMQLVKLDDKYLKKILKIFDDNITEIRQLDDNYLLKYQDKEYKVSDKELYRFLSSGTTKGFNLYIIAVICLKYGFDLIVDEIENHFHKTLVENLIMLFKDKQVNKKNATLIFTTHYCELLDLFNRSDNIWVTHCKEKIEIENMYEKYGLRTELLKSKKFYQNTFETAVNYEALMDLKKEMM